MRLGTQPVRDESAPDADLAEQPLTPDTPVTALSGDHHERAIHPAIVGLPRCGARLFQLAEFRHSQYVSTDSLRAGDVWHLVALAADPSPVLIGAMKREVGAELEVEITAPTTLEFQIAVAPHPNTEVSEWLSFVLDGNPVQPLEISGVHGNRIHKLDAPVGNLKVDYAATITGQTDPAPVTEYDLSMYLRPSRYAEADRFYGFAATEFGATTSIRRLCVRRCPCGWAPG
jgi:hypothetical protein